MLRSKLKSREPVVQSAVDAEADNGTVSKHFSKPLWSMFYDVECELNAELRSLKPIKNIAYVYSPIEYASEIHCAYLRKFLKGEKKVMFVGMNPGPNGMAQTGVPFGNIKTVKNWMGLDGIVNQPEKIHPNRPVNGLSVNVKEPSGDRFWSILQSLAGSLDIYSIQCFMHNFCPLAFFNSAGQNITPSELKGDDKKIIRDICLKYFEKEVELVRPSVIIAVGNYVDDSFKLLKKESKYESIKFLKLPHPSPRSLNNTNWPEKAERFFEENDIVKYIRNEA